MELGGLWWTNFLNSTLPRQRHRPYTWPQHQDPVVHTAQNKREKERKKERKREREKERKRERRREGGREEGRKEIKQNKVIKINNKK